MSVPSLPFVFSANTLIQSAQINSNFSTLVSSLNGNLDSTNFSLSRGLGANYITGTGSGNSGAFQGGAYVFTPNTNAVVPLSVVGLAGQSVDLLDVSTSAAKAVWVDSAGVLHTNQAIAGGVTGSATSVVTGNGPTLVDDASGVNGWNFAVKNGASFGWRYWNGVPGVGPLISQLTAAGTLSATTFSGSGAGLTAIPNAALTNSTISGVALGSNLFSLTPSTHLSGTYNGSAAVSLTIDATNANTASTVVARDPSGNFSAGTITAALTGNASTATALATARAINGVNFDGSAAITIKATATNAHTPGAHLAGGVYDGSAAVTWTTDATSANTASTIVARDAAGAFSAGAITGTSLTSTGGVAAGGAITGATTGAFSSTLSSGAHTVTGNLTATGYIAGLGAALGVTPSAGDVVASRTASGGAIYIGGGSGHASVDYGLRVAGAVTIGSNSTDLGIPLRVGTPGNAQSYVPPVYGASGGALASTTHIATGTATMTSGTSSVTVTLAGASVFASTPVVAAMWSVQGTQGLPTGQLYLDVINSTGSSLVFKSTVAAPTGNVGINFTATGA